MGYVLFTFIIMFGFYIILHFHIKSKKEKMEGEGLFPKNIPFINTFFRYSFLPTFLLMIFLKLEFKGFLILYGYFIMMLYIGNYAYKKTKINEKNKLLKE